VAGILLSAAAVVWLTSRNSHAPPEPNASPSATSSSAATGPSATTSSKTIQTYEQAVRFDPYNADAWFNLAKAQAEVHRTDEALSSAQKALDIARSRNQTALVETIEAWLRSSPDIHPGRSPK
jgi:tetratricopeptide (TPR) repeat protein